MQDLLTYFPELSEYFSSNLEGNYLERHNFRILYVLLIPVIAENLSEKPRLKIISFWMVLLGICSFKFAVLLIPATVLFVLHRQFVRRLSDAWHLLGVVGVFSVSFL